MLSYQRFFFLTLLLFTPPVSQVFDFISFLGLQFLHFSALFTDLKSFPLSVQIPLTAANSNKYFRFRKLTTAGNKLIHKHKLKNDGFAFYYYFFS